MATKTAHFSITGEAMTGLVQARMLDDEPGAAYRLATCLGVEDPVIAATIPSIAMRLCDGVASLEGDESGMDVVERDHPEYREQLAWLFAGRIRLHGRWYRPVAYVSNVGRMDMRNAHGKQVMQAGINRGYTNRAWHYCDKDEIVAEHAAYKGYDVVFRACGERPHWHQPPIGEQAALDEYFATGRGLEERSHSKWYGNESADWPWSRVRPENEPPPPGGGPARYQGTEPNEAMLEKQRLRRVADLRVLILAQAGDDLIELSWEAKDKIPAGKAMIPRAPFVVWSFARLKWFQGLLPEWKPISPSGMKIWDLDDPVHTDWVIGGGLDPQDRDLYWGAKAEAAERLRSKLQDEFDERVRALDESVTTLVTGPRATGLVVHGKEGVATPPGSVVIVPDLRSRWLWAIQGAAAVITQAGGEVAHLAQIARDQAVPVVRAESALARWAEGETVEVDPEARTVRRILQEPDNA